MSMKNLQHLNLSGDEIGELGILEIVNELIQSNSALEELDISGNCIGKNQTYLVKLVDPMITYFNQSQLRILKMGFNNLRGPVEKLLHSFYEMGQIRELDLQSNLLGLSYGSIKNRKPPPISIISEVLIKSQLLKKINIANNGMDAQSALCIAHGLNYTQRLESIDVSSNPIGKLGMQFLIKSMS